MTEIWNGNEVYRRVWRDAVRIAISSGLTTARQSIRSIDERGGHRFHQIWGLGFRG
jgi:hypothetical protein